MARAKRDTHVNVKRKRRLNLNVVRLHRTPANRKDNVKPTLLRYRPPILMSLTDPSARASRTHSSKYRKQTQREQQDTSKQRSDKAMFGGLFSRFYSRPIRSHGLEQQTKPVTPRDGPVMQSLSTGNVHCPENDCSSERRSEELQLPTTRVCGNVAGCPMQQRTEEWRMFPGTT